MFWPEWVTSWDILSLPFCPFLSINNPGHSLLPWHLLEGNFVKNEVLGKCSPFFSSVFR